MEKSNLGETEGSHMTGPCLANGSTITLKKSNLPESKPPVHRVELENVVSHVLLMAESAQQELGLQRVHWRFRIAQDPRFFMNEMQNCSLLSIRLHKKLDLQEVLVELRDVHHFVVPHDQRISEMSGQYLLMFCCIPPNP